MASFLWSFNQTELDTGVVPDNLLHFSKSISKILYIASFATTLSVCLGYGLIRWISPSHDRASLRLLVYGAISHIILGGSSMCRNTKNLPVHACGFCMFLFIFFNVFSAACFTCMAINLHLVYVHSTRHIKHLELYYLIGSFTISFILAIIPLFPKNTHYGYNLSMGVCWYNAPTQKGSLIWALTTIYLWVAIFIVYCCISISLVLVKIRKEEVTINASLALDNKRNYFSHLFFRPHQRLGTICEVQPAAPASLLQSQLSTKNDRKLESSYVLKTVSKVIWYPIILIITRIWGVANICIMATTTKVNPFFYIMSYIALPIQDPAFTAATRRVISSLRHKDEEEKAPTMETTLSRNTENLTNRTASLSRISRQRLSFAHLPTSIQLSAKVHPSQRHSPSTCNQSLFHDSELDLSSTHGSYSG